MLSRQLISRWEKKKERKKQSKANAYARNQIAQAKVMGDCF